ncbi:MAG TPA: prenyltransferase [Verrucomicrobiae bacterium]|nr:prenyltransferase [Verrucomicrobiae bacterium]
MYQKLQIWLRIIRFKFLAASAIAVTNGLVLGYLIHPSSFNFYFAILTYVGIFCLHSSVDLFNDYWDYKRGIDLITKRTKFSGGTGVLPEGLLRPSTVYKAAFIFLILGLAIGTFFIFTKGFIIALILGFATLSIILYSTTLVNFGLGEIFVGIKGMLIVIGTLFIQINEIPNVSIIIGIATGLLSSLVLYINSIPDIRADKEKGRKTLAILLNKYSPATKTTFVIILFITIYILTFVFYYYNGINNILIFTINLLLLPLAIGILKKLNNYLSKEEKISLSFENVMGKTILFSRLYGISIAIGILILCVNNTQK